MQERPILFSSPMIRAIQEGRKGQTRRIMQVQPPGDGYTLSRLMDTTDSNLRRNKDKHHWIILDGLNVLDSDSRYFNCPYGYTGDQLWVRETWCSPDRPIIGYAADSKCGAWINDGDGGRIWLAHGYILEAPSYRDVVKNLKYAPTFGIKKYGGKWRPSIFMPRWASRIQLEVIGVRVQRLQDISEFDAQEEGGPKGYDLYQMHYSNAREWFAKGWDSLNLKRGSWESNPWVWVISFKQIKGENYEKNSKDSSSSMDKR